MTESYWPTAMFVGQSLQSNSISSRRREIRVPGMIAGWYILQVAMYCLVVYGVLRRNIEYSVVVV